MANRGDTPPAIDSTAMGIGFVLGLLLGGAVALFKIPKSGLFTRQQLSETGQTLRSKLEAAVPADPIAASIAEGKEAARRRRAELGLDQ